jgi:hypothetical protein
MPPCFYLVVQQPRDTGQVRGGVNERVQGLQQLIRHLRAGLLALRGAVSIGAETQKRRSTCG